MGDSAENGPFGPQTTKRRGGKNSLGAFRGEDQSWSEGQILGGCFRLIESIKISLKLEGLGLFSSVQQVKGKVHLKLFSFVMFRCLCIAFLACFIRFPSAESQTELEK